MKWLILLLFTPCVSFAQSDRTSIMKSVRGADAICTYFVQDADCGGHLKTIFIFSDGTLIVDTTIETDTVLLFKRYKPILKIK
jgi:hypothetical protein